VSSEPGASLPIRFIPITRVVVRSSYCDAFDQSWLISTLLARARMGLVVDLGEVLEIQMGVDLGGGDVGVTQ